MVLTVSLDADGRISETGFEGEGCSISQASASMLASHLGGQTIEEAEALVQTFKGVMQGEELTEEEEDALGDIVALQGVREFPIRIKCALLGWTTLQRHRRLPEDAGGIAREHRSTLNSSQHPQTHPVPWPAVGLLPIANFPDLPVVLKECHLSKVPEVAKVGIHPTGLESIGHAAEEIRSICAFGLEPYPSSSTTTAVP